MRTNLLCLVDQGKNSVNLRMLEPHPAIELSRYVVEPLRKDENYILYRGRSKYEASQILVLSPLAEYPAPEILKLLEHEYSLREELDPTWVARPITMARHWDRTVLVLEDPGGVPLDQLLGQQLEVAFSLRLAISLSRAIDHLHQRDTIHKDIKPANVLVNNLTQRQPYPKDERRSEISFSAMVGKSAALRYVLQQVETVAPSDSTVLILGETGTGKELIASAVHRRSRRRDKPLIRVNCASIPKELFESEFFGHAKGSFTGAIKDRSGRFEAAAGGTLFLDEVGEIPLELQSKLLRVLQEKSYERVGEERTRHADVRIVAATNRDLKKEVAAGRFREDLYYRLNVFPLRVAALRERKEDIPLLATHCVELLVSQLGCPKPRLTRAGLETLQYYDWPGNIRELRNVIERAVISARGGALEFDLPETDTSVDLTSFGTRDDQVEPEYLTESEMRRRERENMFAVLRKAGWKIKGVDGAAELLGVKPTTLSSRIEKMGLKRPA